MQASSGGKSIGAPQSAVTFDASGQRTSSDFTLSQGDLDQLDGTSGTWPPAGVTIEMGSANDPNRVAMGSGGSKTAVLEQNGGDGTSLSGVVTGIKITADGPTLTIGGRDIPLASVMEVQAPAPDRAPARLLRAGGANTISIRFFSSAIPREEVNMLRSMFAAVTGLRSHQAFMDVVGNNIANVNTTGYKAGTVEFEDLLSQTMNGAGAPPSAPAGGTNPAQVGLGVRLAGIGTNFSQGAAQETGRSTDFAIQGDGFFVVKEGGVQEYTRNGSFSLDGLGQLVTGDGGIVQGWQADPTGAVNTNSSPGAVKIPVGQTIAPVTTSNINIGGNLPADTATGATIDVSIDVNNSLGASIPLRMEFTKVPDTAGSVNWTVTTYDSANNAIAGPTAGEVRRPPGNLTTSNITLTQAQLELDRGHVGHVGRGRHRPRLRHRDRRRPPHRARRRSTASQHSRRTVRASAHS